MSTNLLYSQFTALEKARADKTIHKINISHT